MTSTVQHRRGTAAEHTAFTGAEGEFTYDTTDKRIVAHDGSTAGGIPLAKESEAGITATVAASGKTTPVDADVFGIADSADSDALKKVTFANLATWFGSKLGAVTAALTGKTTPVDADEIAITDSAASSATKKLTWANLKATLKTYNDTLYQPLATALTNFTTLVGTIVSGDLIYGSGAATLARLAKGTDGHVLTLASGVPSWAAAASGSSVKRNRIVNPAMQISSVNGNTAGTATGYVPADNWSKYHVSSAGTLTVQRVQSRTPNGSLDRLRVTITAADASLAAGEYLTISQNIVGREVADFQYGTASAIQSILRFGFKGPQGTYAVALHNSALDRSYVSLFTISAPQANTDTEQTITIPGDTTGTWLTDSGTGITVDIVLACGSTFQGTTGWQAGNILGTSGVSNGMAAISDVFEVFDVGLYADPESTGSAPEWELPSYNGLRRSGLELLTFGSVSAVAQLNIPLTGYTDYRGVLIKLYNFIPATDGVELRTRVSSNGGSSYDSGASDYRWASFVLNDTPAQAAQGSGGAAYGSVAGSNNPVGNASNEGVTVSVEVLGQTDTATKPAIRFDCAFYSSVNRAIRESGTVVRDIAQDTDAIQFYFSSGNITSGGYAVYGYV